MEVFTPSSGSTLPKVFGAAQSDLQRLADGGNADAQYLLGAFYLNGLGSPRDPVKAKLWLEKSAAQGNSHAAFSLASLYADSDPPDLQAAEHWRARPRARLRAADAQCGDGGCCGGFQRHSRGTHHRSESQT